MKRKSSFQELKKLDFWKSKHWHASQKLAIGKISHKRDKIHVNINKEKINAKWTLFHYLVMNKVDSCLQIEGEEEKILEKFFVYQTYETREFGGENFKFKAFL